MSLTNAPSWILLAGKDEAVDGKFLGAGPLGASMVGAKILGAKFLRPKILGRNFLVHRVAPSRLACSLAVG